jgi:hypothetical protein
MLAVGTGERKTAVREDPAVKTGASQWIKDLETNRIGHSTCRKNWR